MFQLKLKGKLILPTVIVMALLVVGINAYSVNNFSRFTTSLLGDRIRESAQSLKVFLADCKESTVAAATKPASDQDMVDAVKSRDREEITRLLQSFLEPNWVNFFTVCDDEGIVLARTHEPSLYGDSILHQQNVTDALSGQTGTYFEGDAVVKISMRTGAPVYDTDGTLIGVISAGVRLDTNDMADNLKARIGADFTVFLGDTKIATTIYSDGERAEGTRINPDIAAVVIDGKQEYYGHSNVLGEDYSTFYMPLFNTEGDVFAVLFAGKPNTELITQTNALNSSGLLFGLAGLGISILAMLLITGRVIRPIKRLSSLVSKVAAGNLEMDRADDHISKDEIGMLTRDIYVLITVIKTMLADLTQIAHEHSTNGDYEYRIDVEKYTGSYRVMANGINDFADVHTGEILHVLDLVAEVGHGNFDVEINVLPGKKRVLSYNFNLLVSSLRNLHAEITDLARSVSAGNLNVKADESKYQGGWARLLTTLNSLVTAVSEMNKAMNIMDQIKTMICITDKDFNLLYFNLSMSTAFGVKIEDCIGQKCYKVLRGFDEPCAICRTKDLLPANETFPAIDYSDVWDSALNMWIGGRASIIRWVDGSLVYLYTINDETAEHTLKEQNREIDERTHLMLDATPLSCKLWDKDFNLIDCNQESVTLYGLTSKQEYLERYLELSPEYQPNGRTSEEMRQEYLEKAFREGYCRIEWVHRKPDGEIFPTELTLVRIKFKDEYIVAGYTQDLRELKATLGEMHKAQEHLRLARDAAETANKAKSSFLANMSHEIRTPMNSIIGFSELAMDGNIPSKARKYFTKILENAEWLLQIINDILDISKIESGKMELDRVPFDLYDLLTRCQSMVLPKAMEKGIHLFFHAEPCIDKQLLGDPVRVRQVLTNILSNAVKFTDHGAIILSSIIKSTSDDKTVVYFEVKDSGIGMTDEQIQRVFEPFVQADISVTRRFGGTGLGLPITKNIIEMMGGTLQVESAPNTGSKFFFELAFDTIEATGHASKRAFIDGALEKPTFQGEVLVCEDNEMNQQVIFEHLSRVGLTTVMAHNGKEGVDIVEKRMLSGQKPFDLIFMDVQMPVMDGREAASKITELGVTTPIIALTANIMPHDVELYANCGMSGYLGKPFTSQEFWRCLLEYLTSAESHAVNQHSLDASEEDLKNRLGIHFAARNQHTCDDIATAIQAGDIKLAHRLAHTLKGNAGQIGKKRLQDAAAVVENRLSGGVSTIRDKHLRVLETEMDAVLEELLPLLEKSQDVSKVISGDEARSLIERLETMVKDSNPECMDLLDDIRAIPEAGELARQIEDFEFKQALVTIYQMKEKLASAQ